LQVFCSSLGKDAVTANNKDESMQGTRNASPLQCTYADFSRVRGYSSIRDLAKQQKQASRLFELVDGGMKLPFLSKSIQASPLLDRLVATELETYRNPDTRQFGEDGPSSPEELAAACLPTHQLDADTCAQFSKVGSGDWPRDVEQWCGEKYQIHLKAL